MYYDDEYRATSRRASVDEFSFLVALKPPRITDLCGLWLVNSALSVDFKRKKNKFNKKKKLS